MQKAFSAPDANFEIDLENSLFTFAWKGTVSEKSVKRILTLASNASSDMKSCHWLIDRRELDGYSPEARIWIKNNFMKATGTDLISKTDKIAAINSESAMAQVSSNVLIDALQKLNPKIGYKEFDMPAPAINWLSGKSDPLPEVKKKRGLFGRKK